MGLSPEPEGRTNGHGRKKTRRRRHEYPRTEQRRIGKPSAAQPAVRADASALRAPAPLNGALGSLESMTCWICGSPANSAEHFIKASDLRLMFGRISPNSPLFLHYEAGKGLPIHSAKSDKLKTSKVLCARCNDTRSAPFDEAWSKLFAYIFANWRRIKISRRLKLQGVFPGAVGHNALLFHLYFVKLFGCRIAHDKVRIDIRPFASSILNERAHPTLYLTFNCRTLPTKKARFAGPSEIHAMERDGELISASWYYTLDELDVQITWFAAAPLKNVPGAWHPTKGGKILAFRAR